MLAFYVSKCAERQQAFSSNKYALLHHWKRQLSCFLMMLHQLVSSMLHNLERENNVIQKSIVLKTDIPKSSQKFVKRNQYNEQKA